MICFKLGLSCAKLRESLELPGFDYFFAYYFDWLCLNNVVIQGVPQYFGHLEIWNFSASEAPKINNFDIFQNTPSLDWPNPMRKNT